MEEVSIDEMKEELTELITMQQRRLDSASTELTKAMGLGEELEATLFDNEFERNAKKYPLVTAALEKTLPNIMDTEQIADATMPSDDTPVTNNARGGDPLTEAIEKYNKAKYTID